MNCRGAVLVLFGQVLTAALLLGCSTLDADLKSPKDVVVKRAQARWDALLRRDWTAAYGYLTPAYRALVPAERYGNQFSGPMQWQGARVTGAECEDKRCVATVEVTFRLLLPGHMDRVSSTYVEEIWLLEDGHWYKFEKL